MKKLLFNRRPLFVIPQVKIRRKRIGDDFIPYVTKTEVSSKDLPLVDGVVALGNGRICDHESTPNTYEDDDEEDEEEEEEEYDEGKNGKQKKGECPVLFTLFGNINISVYYRSFVLGF